MPNRLGLDQLSDRAVRGRFFEALANSKLIGWVEAISNHFDSDTDIEEYTWLTMAPVLREWVNGKLIRRLAVNRLEIENLDFEATIGIALKHLRRDKTAQLDIRLADLAARTQTHWASLLSTLIINGDSTACYDGQNFFSASHSEGSSGTQSNLLTKTDYSQLDVTTTTNPTANEMADAIMVVVQHLYGLKDDKAEPRNEDALEFLAMVPTNMWGACQTAIRANLLNTGSGSIDNVLSKVDWKLTPAVNPRLTGTSDFFVFRSDVASKPFIRQEEQDINPKILGPGSDHEFKEAEWLFSVETSRNVGYGMWWAAAKATLG